MPRTFTQLLIVLLSIVLLVGCGWGKSREEKAQAKEAKARAKEEKKQAEAAAKPKGEFESSEKDPPLSVQTRYAAGQLAESQGNFPNAVNQYNETLKLDPKHAGAMFRLGGVLTQMGKFDDAIATWQRYIKLTNNSAQAYSNLALTYELSKRPADAEQTYKAGIARDPDNPACRVNYGLMLAKQNRLDEAIAQLSTVLKPAEVHYNLGSVFEQMRKPQQAKAYYQKALDLDPNLHDARSKLAKLR